MEKPGGQGGHLRNPLSPEGEGRGGGGKSPLCQSQKCRGRRAPAFLLHLPGCLPPRAPGPRFPLFDPSAPGFGLFVGSVLGPHRFELVVQGGAQLAAPPVLPDQTAVSRHGLGRRRGPGRQG
jgi:hypothetical protein